MFVIHVSILFRPGVHAEEGRGQRIASWVNEGASLKEAYIGRRTEGREGGKEAKVKKK